ncbi:probable cytokinin riboside 5'-monophosphate phosphoribohydrolase LOG4 [Acropora millepora]|uniref:probable cytokinin riboside 5'-monophosphate phosphoribohydrolase LOG4 n=1 Tax=Acropora millepora TaxID=45264 RepID=UPI0010FCBED9|nr:probable cytokinin riboside 5'-monophosphate phosphoribohydrolase LOG4 [Acropora millepora]
MALKTVTVFCGSSLGNDPRFQESAKALGECLAKRKINLIYGGGTSGLMGTIAKTMSDAGCVVTGFLPEFFVKRGDCELDSFGKTVMVTDMHTRKQQMFEQADAMIALPGGFGTIEELLEMVTWYQLKLHDKPVGLLNVANYWGGLIEWIQNAVQAGFIYDQNKDILLVADDCDTLIKKLEERASANLVKRTEKSVTVN